MEIKLDLLIFYEYEENHCDIEQHSLLKIMSTQQRPIGGKGGDQPGISESDLKFIQGDILVGMAKRVENFVFFTIKDPQQFRTQLQEFSKQITNAKEAIQFRERIKKSEEKLVPNSAMNIAFSAKGLKALGADLTDIDDEPFLNGQLASAKDLGDDLTKWDKLFKGQGDKLKGDIHGVVIIVASEPNMLQGATQNVEKMFRVGQQNAIINTETVGGNVRKDTERGHEHFGFRDGISQPMIDGLGELVSDKTDSAPPIDPGVILLGRRGNTKEIKNPKTPRVPGDTDTIVVVRDPPGWARDGSFMVFRKLEQHVLEFNHDIQKRAEDMGISSDLLGARLVGRWKSGAPVQNTQVQNASAKDPVKNGDDESPEATSQDFKFSIQDQQSCPFVAHIRKTNPRDDLKGLKNRPGKRDPVMPHRIFRRGIQYGREVGTEEIINDPKPKPENQRGLLFACYQSSIEDGFEFIQKAWISNPTFPPGANVSRHTEPKQQNPLLQSLSGVDPLIGTPTLDSYRNVLGLSSNTRVPSLDVLRSYVGANPNKLKEESPLPPEDWVVSKGGEYFFSPSIPALKNKPFAP